MIKFRTAVCAREVPKVLSPTGKAIKKGATIEFVKLVFNNGEGQLVLADGNRIPDIFFNVN